MIIDSLLKPFNRDPTIRRHLLKTISWRLIGSLDTALIGWIITGKLIMGAQIGSVELITKMVLYFVHERVWHKVKFGTEEK